MAADFVRLWSNCEAMRSKGIKLIDLGCMQINHYYHGDKFADVRGDVRSGQERRLCGALSERTEAREGSWTMAVARYNAGPNNQPAQKRYVCQRDRHLVASGFGSWTGRRAPSAATATSERRPASADSPAQGRTSNENTYEGDD